VGARRKKEGIERGLKLLDPNSPERRFLFEPCHSKEQLRDWVLAYLNIDLPDGRVDPTSNSSPMELLWEVYSAALYGNVEWSEILAYASRDSYKTLGASILETLAILHLERSVAHMAAIEAQAKNSQKYMKGFFHKPLLRPFITEENERQITITRYFDPRTRLSYCEQELDSLSAQVLSRLETKSNSVKIIICTPQGTNSDHVPFMVVDEVDVVANKDAYHEAKMIPSPWMGKTPVTLYTSTRKYSIGLVQEEIDKVEAGESDMEIRHWNLLDVTERCPPSRHLPEQPRIPIYVNDSTLKAVAEEQYQRLGAVQQEKFQRFEGYAGCLSNCKLFAVCRGRLPHQTGTGPLMKTIQHTTMMFRKVTPDKAKAQLLCWKPSKEGMIYPNLDLDTHRKTAAQIAEMITGDEFPESFEKNDLIKFAQERGCEFVSGVDHGYSHNFAVVTGFIDGDRLFIFDVISVAELEIGSKVELLERQIKPWDPTLWCDPADPSARVTFVKHGFRAPKWAKTAGSVLEGIDAVRLKLSPALGGPPELFILKGEDEHGCDLLFSRLSKYHWVLDAAEKPTDVPDDDDDDECDALRYLVMNRFSAKKLRARSGHMPPANVAHQHRVEPGAQYHQQNWMRQKVAELTGDYLSPLNDENATPGLIKKGGFIAAF
jgi:hypothetical protein